MKKLMMLAAVIASAGFIHADVLYWMVNDENADAAKARGEETAATLYAIVGSDYSTKKALDSVTGNDVADYYGVSSFDTQLGSYSGSTYSYFVELWNGNQSSPVDYQSALNNGYISRNGMSTPSVEGMSGGLGSGSQTYNVPEPTSGLLFVIGGMLLGLKRKRQV